MLKHYRVTFSFTVEECGEISRAALRGEMSVRNMDPTVRDGGV